MILDIEAVYDEAGADAEWLAGNVPLFECPDDALQRTYHFRWRVFRRHLRHTPDGWVVTEFLPAVPWAGAHNTISCAAGHHFREGRWLRDRRYLADYARFWFRGGGEPRRYSFWAADALHAWALATGELDPVVELLPDLVANFSCWQRERCDPSGLYWQHDDRDGMEFSLGGSGCRPTINSYMYGDAAAISAIAEAAGEAATAERHRVEAERLRRLVQQRLWDERAGFFKTLLNPRGLAYTAGLPQGWKARERLLNRSPGTLAPVRELAGYAPWYFGLPDQAHTRDFAEAWTQLLDADGFAAPFGLTTAERRDPYFMCPHTHECLWNGPVWPYATTQTLVALANALQDGPQGGVTDAHYLDALRTYAAAQRLRRPDGVVVPWIDENLDPFTGEWIARRELHARGDPLRDRGEDYNHSGFCDLVITGLVGLRPQADRRVVLRPLVPDGVWDHFCLDGVPYHGRSVTVLYDRHGARYGRGAGLRVLVDGRERAAAPRLQPLTTRLDA